MMEDKKWFDDLKDKMDVFEDSVPEGLWEDIETSIFPERKRRSVVVPPWLWRGVAAAAAVAVGAFIGVRLIDSPAPSTEGQINVVAVAPEVSAPEAPTADDEGISQAAQAAEGLLADARPKARVRSKAGASSRRTEKTAAEATIVPEVELKEASLPTEPECEVVETPSVKDSQPTENRKVGENYEYESWDRYLSETASKKTSGSSPVNVNVSFSGGATSSSDMKSFDPMMFYRGSDPGFDHPGSMDAASLPNNNIQTRSMSPSVFSSSAPVTTESEHRRPVRVALTVNKPLGRVFGVESGLSYSTLRSTFTKTSGSTVTESDQTLRYLGVPLNLTASAYSSKRFGVYVSGGGMAEKCVSGRIRTTETVSGVRQDGVNSTSLTVKPVLWSLNAAAGVQANLTSNLGLYVEPGVSYHFDDGSSVQTVYKDRPLDFVMTFGARLRIGQK